MKVVLLASFLLFSLLCGVQGQECVALDNEYYWDDVYEENSDYYLDEPTTCGCQIEDVNGHPIFNVSLDFFDKVYVKY